jgi:streptogramin lyase
MILAKQGSNVLVRFDPRTLRRTKTISPNVPNSLGKSVAVGEGGVWWSGGDSGTIWRVDPPTGTITKTIRITPPPGTVNDFTPQLIATGPDAVWVTVTFSP